MPYRSICPVHGVVNAHFDGSCWCHRSTHEEAYELKCLGCGWHGEDAEPNLDEDDFYAAEWTCPKCGEGIEEEDILECEKYENEFELSVDYSPVISTEKFPSNGKI